MGPPVDLRSVEGAVHLARDVVLVSGPEAVSYLQGQLSQDVEALGIGDSAPSLLLQPTGKVDAWVRATRTGEEELALDTDVGHGDAVLARLKRFLLRTNAEITAVRWSGWALRGPSIERREGVSPHVLALPPGWPGIAGVDLLGDDVPRPAGLQEVEPQALDALRIECGVPAMGAELTDATIPAEAGPWLIDASVSFTKGCYTGQELVARIDSRGGNVPRPVRGLVVDGDPVAVGSTVTAGDTEVGHVTSSATSPALGAVALAPLARSVEPGSQVVVGTAHGGAQTATVTDLPMR
jgi:folate-binding protein YgfZ